MRSENECKTSSRPDASAVDAAVADEEDDDPSVLVSSSCMEETTPVAEMLARISREESLDDEG